MRNEERGFTLIEMLTAMALSAILLTLAAASLRHFSMVQALNGAVDEVASHLRRAQSRSVSESHPLVYGAWFERGSPVWRLVRFDPKVAGTTADDACTSEESRELGTGMFSSRVRISSVAADTSFADTYETGVCRAALGAAGVENQFVFFYARGDATAGQVTVEHPTLGRTRAIQVTGLTARVEKP